MTTQLYLQKAEMQLSRGLEEKALESLLGIMQRFGLNTEQ